MKSKVKTIITLWLTIGTLSAFSQGTAPKQLTPDGAWCWFSAPGAIYRHAGTPQVVTGWVTSDGSIEGAVLNLRTGEKSVQTVSPKLDRDDHANPSFVELQNKDVLMCYTKHFDTHVKFNRLSAKSKEADFGVTETVDVFDQGQFELYPKKGVTYVNPMVLAKEAGRLYCFGRWTGYKPNMMWSDDGGLTFSSAQVFITNYPFKDDNRPYVRYCSNGESKIHLIFTDGHPRKEPTNSVYYAYYQEGAFWRVDGSKICDLDNLPFEPSEASVVYRANEDSGRAWVFDIAADEKDKPVILYARYPKETEHLYHYVTYDGSGWADREICHAGKWFPQTPQNGYEREPHYSAGMTLHPLKPNTVYLSRDIDGVFEIEKRVTHDAGKSWEVSPLTRNSPFDNVRPVVPRNMREGDATVLLWMVNEKYVHYTDYKTRIEYIVED